MADRLKEAEAWFRERGEADLRRFSITAVLNHTIPPAIEQELQHALFRLNVADRLAAIIRREDGPPEESGE